MSSNSGRALDHIRRLHSLIVTDHGAEQAVNGMNRAMEWMRHVRGIGTVGGAGHNGGAERYFTVDGPCWHEVPGKIDVDASPSFVLVEEDVLFSCLESQIAGPGGGNGNGEDETP